MEIFRHRDETPELPLAQRAVLAAALLAGCAAPQLPQTEKPGPEKSKLRLQLAPPPLDAFCKKTIGKLRAVLDPESPTRCTEDNSEQSPRSYELRGACNGMISNLEVEKVEDELRRAAKACFLLKEAASKRAQAEQRREAERKRAETQSPVEAWKEPVVTEICGKTLDYLDEILVARDEAIMMCGQDNSRKGPRFARLKRDCERGISLESPRIWLPRRVVDMVDSLDRADLYCRQTDPSYRRMTQQKPQ